MAILFRRDQEDNKGVAASSAYHMPDVLPLLTTLFLLFCVIIICGIVLYFIRRYRKENIPKNGNGTNRPLTITAIPWRRNSQVDMEKQALMGNTSPMPMTPDSIPEIRITFPEEEDAHGRRKSGRVVIVQVGESGVGFVRPVPEDQLPPYQQRDGFSSVDLEKIGGLKEKDNGNCRWI